MIQSELILASRVKNTGDKAYTFEVVLPRIVLAELNTHRMFSRNSASSRTIPAIRMLSKIIQNAFIPIAFQKKHKGMQGKEYFEKNEMIEIKELRDNLIEVINEIGDKATQEPNNQGNIIAAVDCFLFDHLEFPQRDTDRVNRTFIWEAIASNAVMSSALLLASGVTKQLTNRIVEPFMYHKALITVTESGLANFFKLRGAVYAWKGLNKGAYSTRNEVLENHLNDANIDIPQSEVEWLKLNKGMAEIHIMRLAELMQEEVDNAEFQELNSNEWHIPYSKYIRFDIEDYTLEDAEKVMKYVPELNNRSVAIKIAISAGMAARTSYTSFDGNIDSSKTMRGFFDLGLKLLEQSPPHSSPLEHQIKAMNNDDLDDFIVTTPRTTSNRAYNMEGFVPFRYYVDNYNL